MRRSDGCASGGEHREDLSGSGGSGQGALTLVVEFHAVRCAVFEVGEDSVRMIARWDGD